MLRAHKSTFKPTASNCLTRDDVTFGKYQSLGLGSTDDAAFDASDDFEDFTDSSYTYIIPDYTNIVRVYLSAGAPVSNCVQYGDPCNVSDAEVFCPAGSACCPICENNANQVICCEPENGSCEVKCPEDCTPATPSSPWNNCTNQVEYTGQDAEEIAEICEQCGKFGCVADCGSNLPGCIGRCIEQGYDGCSEDVYNTAGCNDECGVEPPTTSWVCGADEACSVPPCGVCREVPGSKGYGSKAECTIKSSCGTKETDPRADCCGGVCREIPPGEDPLECNDGNDPILYCSLEDCEICNTCQTQLSNSVYSSVSVVPAFSTGKKNTGDDLSANELSILNFGEPTLTTAQNINEQTAKAYNSRLLYLNILNSNTYATTNVSESDEIIVLSNLGGDCNVCLEGDAILDEYVMCGVANPSMFIAEYNVGGLCSETIELSIKVNRRTFNGNEDLSVELIACPKDNDGSALGEEFTLLKDVVTSGVVTPNGNAGGRICEEEFPCGITFDCTGTEVRNGSYPTLTRTIKNSDVLEFRIPDDQVGFETAGVGNQEKTTNVRNSNHTIGDGTFSIVTTVLARGNNEDDPEPMYKNSSVDSMIPNLIGGAADHTPRNDTTTIGDRLLDDVDRATSQTQGVTFINGNSNSLSEEYGIPNTECTNNTDVGVDGGESLFAVVYTDRSRPIN